MNIYKNFLNEKDFKVLESKMMGDTFPWYYNNEVVNKGDEFFQFTYVFVVNGKENCKPEVMELLKPILKKLKYKKMERIKANLLTKSESIIEHGLHTDIENMTTGIFYLNDCNGYTKFSGGKKIKSEKNKYVTFDSNTMHTGSTCTDQKRRVVINFNYS
tara:strand:+ start:152 stop:628 length:477 start_codon:yes stop_codon:yes gene_type:complete